MVLSGKPLIEYTYTHRFGEDQGNRSEIGWRYCLLPEFDGKFLGFDLSQPMEMTHYWRLWHRIISGAINGCGYPAM
jgi:hypothetical protein